MATLKRAYIPYQERLAAALACLLPQEERDIYRRGRYSAKAIITHFTFDHIHLHSLGGSDKWWNLDPKRRGPELKKKDSLDTTIAAKAQRLADAHDDFRRRVLRVKKKPWKPKPEWTRNEWAKWIRSEQRRKWKRTR